MSMKKFVSDKDQNKNNLFGWLNKKGFYFILVIGILVIGTLIVMFTKQDFKFLNLFTNSEENSIPEDFEDYLQGIELEDKENYQWFDGDEDGNENADVDVGADEDEDEDIDTLASLDINEYESVDIVKDKDTGQASEELVSLNEEEKESSIFIAQAEENKDEEKTDDKLEPSFVMPVYGDIICDFAMDKLVYSKTLEDWRVHRGIDIAAIRGTAVKAVANGVISELIEDPKLGNTIVIDHENGLKTVYSNLASLDMVLPNQIVTTGETIGAIGESALFETALEPHLHFEVVKEGIFVDPKLYLPEY